MYDHSTGECFNLASEGTGDGKAINRYEDHEKEDSDDDEDV